MKGKKAMLGASSSGGGCGRRGGHGRGRGRGDRAHSGHAGRGESSDRGKQKKHRKFDITNVKCFNRNEMGHFKSDCPEPCCENANFVQQEEEDDPGLLMLEACELTSREEEVPVQVFLNEEKVVPKLTGSHDTSWYLDTGASNHMTGNSKKFVELDQTMHGKVRFGDGSAVEIVGRGAVLLQCLTGEH